MSTMRGTRPMLLTLVMTVSRLADVASLVPIARFRRRVEQGLSTSSPRVCFRMLDAMRGAEFGWIVGTLCPTRCVGYVVLTMMAKKQVLRAIAGAFLMEAVLWWLCPIGIDFLILDLVLTFAVTFMWPSRLAFAFRRAAMGCPFCMEFIPYLACFAWYCCLAVLGDLPLFFRIVEWLESGMKPQETAVALRLPDERIWDSCRRPEAPPLPQYYPKEHGTFTVVGYVVASIQLVAFAVWRWGRLGFVLLFGRNYLRDRGPAAIGME